MPLAELLILDFQPLDLGLLPDYVLPHARDLRFPIRDNCL
jgi:hypothetical protein